MLYRRTDTPATTQRVFLAVAAYQGLSAGFTYALFHSAQALQSAGIESELAIFSGNCHVDDSRNRLVRDFLNSDCTDLVFLDADVQWFPRELVELTQYDRDVVAGIYPKKHGDDGYPLMLLPGEIWSDRDGLIEVLGVPTGFLRIKRHVLETLAAKSQYYNAKNDANSAVPCIFERQIHDGERWGGDYVFCRKWRETGGKIYIAPKMRFEHSGEHTWAGSVGPWLKQRAGLGLVDALNAFRAGTEDIQDAVDLFDAWGNPYAADPILLMGLGMAARNTKGPILELGAGLSTLVLASSAPHTELHVLEDSPIYAEQVMSAAARHGLTNIVMHCRDVKDGWYDTSTLPAHVWSLVFIDGPRRTIGGRIEAFYRMDLSHSTVIADDVQGDGGIPELKTQLEKTHRVEVCGAARRNFAVGVPKLRLAAAAE